MWARNELNSYQDSANLPDYRKVPAQSYSNYHTFSSVSVHQISRAPVKPNFDYAYQAEIFAGMSSIEDMIRKSERETSTVLQIDWDRPMFDALSKIFAKQGGQLLRAWKEVSSSSLVQIADSAKNRLLDFVIELENLAADSGDQLGGLQKPDVENLVNRIILRNPEFVIQEVKTMTIFDQRGQNVNYQYNAAGNINFSNVKNRNELIGQLERLQSEVENAISTGQLDEDAATDASYQMTKAVQQAKKEDAQQGTIIKHLKNVKGLIAGAASLAGLIKGVSEAIEAVQNFF